MDLLRNSLISVTKLRILKLDEGKPTKDLRRLFEEKKLSCALKL